MKPHLVVMLGISSVISVPAFAAQDGCPGGSYSVIVSPDQTTLSILFDKFQVESTALDGAGVVSKVCHIVTPLDLPPNSSLGVYKVDYRGFAKLAPAQQASLEVQYALGPRGNEHGRVFKRKVKGEHDGDYFFTEHIGAGQMKRVGCGAEAKLDMTIALSVMGTSGAMASLDSSDGKSAAMVYHLNVKKCDE